MKFLPFFLLFCTTLFAKNNFDLIHKNPEFIENTGLTDLSNFDPEEDKIIYVVDKTLMQYLATDKFKSEELDRKIMFQFKTIHKRVRLSNDEAVESYNKVYIPVSGTSDLINIKARVINPDETVINFDEEDVKFIENYENYGPMNIFALDGIQVGAEVEYIYTIQNYSENFYGHIYPQNDHPKMNFHYEIIYPKHLIFETKSYNNAPELLTDTIDDETYRLSANKENIKGFESEQYSAQDANLMRIEFVLRQNTFSPGDKFYTWKSASKEYTGFSYEYASDKKMNKKETKAMKKFRKKIGLDDIKNDKEKIFAIEQYIKTKLNIDEDYNSVLLHDIYKQKNASKFGAFRLYTLLLKLYDIEHETVITHNRFEKDFDTEFETYNFLEKRLIYFPELDLYTDPSAFNLRVGTIPFGYAYTDGLFFRMKEIGGATAFYPHTKYIEGLAYDQSYDNMKIDVQLSDDFDKCTILVQKEMKGYSSSNIRPFLSFMNEERKEESLKELIVSVGDDAEVISVKADNTEMKGFMMDNPFLVEGKVEVSSIIQKAGNNYIIKIGQVIGPQVEMYQEKDRKFSVENYFNHSYNRVINFTIPDGYEVSNLEELNMDVFVEKDGKRIMEFTCSYEIKDNVITVTVNEFYNEVKIPISMYEEFRAVINAAADFNKKTLILKQK